MQPRAVGEDFSRDTVCTIVDDMFADVAGDRVKLMLVVDITDRDCEAAKSFINEKRWFQGKGCAWTAVVLGFTLVSMVVLCRVMGNGIQRGMKVLVLSSFYVYGK